VVVADRDNDAVPDAEDACPDVPGLPTADPKTNGCPAEGEHVRVEGMRIVLDDIIHFESDSPRVRRVSYTLIRHVADYIRQMEDVLEVDIEGHADITGTEQHNQWLSEQRAKSVKSLLVQFGVPDEKLTTRGHGELAPRVAGNTELSFRQNRRVEFVITRSRAREDSSRAPEATAHTGSAP
jgi:OOP family OmpA-OmpF porin